MSERLAELKWLLIFIVVFLLAYFIPVSSSRFQNGVMEAFYMLQDYARLHVLLCLVPALFIAGAVSVFVSKDSIIKYLGPTANKLLAYGVAAVSGAILAVCSCTILPLFSGIYKRGAGLGPAIAFLYSGPAINVLAIVMTARVLGLEIGIARGLGAVIFSVIIGLIMHLLFRKEELDRQGNMMQFSSSGEQRPLWQTTVYFALMIGILIFLNWAKPNPATDSAVMQAIYINKWLISAVFGWFLGIMLHLSYGFKIWKLLIISVITILCGIFFPQQPLIAYLGALISFSAFMCFEKGELSDWLGSSWNYAKLILPLLFFGVMVAGSLLGRPGFEAWMPSVWIERAVGGNSLIANLFASVSGAFMYFATLTEVPILEGLRGSGMGNGPALALLLSGPALSLPSMLVINTVLGFKKTFAFVSLVIIMSTITGYLFGVMF